MSNLRHIALNIIFPASTLLSLGIFLFLCALLIASYTGYLYEYFLLAVEAIFVQGWMNSGKDVPQTVIIIPGAALAFCAFVYVLMYILLGRYADSASSLRTFPLYLYGLSVLGASINGKEISLPILYFSLLIIYGAAFINQKIVELEPRLSSSQKTRLDPLESLWGVLLSGVGFLYYLLLKDQTPLVATLSAYMVFTLGMTVYRFMQDMHTPQTRAN